MSPHRRNALRFSPALCAGVTLATAPAAFAGDQPHPFVLSAYPRAAGDRALLTGRYRTAAHQLRGRADGPALDAAGAQRDFARARALSPYSSFVRRNLTAMKFHDTTVHARGT